MYIKIRAELQEVWKQFEKKHVTVNLRIQHQRQLLQKRHRSLCKNQCLSEGASSETPSMTMSEISQYCRLPERIKHRVGWRQLSFKY